jgi:hypothetical protein
MNFLRYQMFETTWFYSIYLVAANNRLHNNTITINEVYLQRKILFHVSMSYRLETETMKT